MQRRARWLILTILPLLPISSLVGTACGGCPTVRFSLDVHSESVGLLLEEADTRFDLKSVAEINAIDQKKYDLCAASNTMEIFDGSGNRVGTVHIPNEAIHVADSEAPIVFITFQSGQPSRLSVRIEYQTLAPATLL